MITGLYQGLSSKATAGSPSQNSSCPALSYKYSSTMSLCQSVFLPCSQCNVDCFMCSERHSIIISALCCVSVTRFHGSYWKCKEAEVELYGAVFYTLVLPYYKAHSSSGHGGGHRECVHAPGIVSPVG